MGGRLHLNTAGSGLVPAQVVDSMVAYLREEAEFGSYETEARYGEVLKREIYENLSEVINAPPEDLALFDSATRAWCSVICNLEFTANDRVWVTPYEYAGNLISLLELRERFGFTIEIVPVLPNGDLDLRWMESEIDERVSLVSVAHIPSGCGIVNPVREIGAIVAPWRCVYAVDACQSVGQIPIDVHAIKCQLLTGAGRKFLRGPRGTGFAYVSPTVRSRMKTPFYDLHAAEMVSHDAYRVTDESARKVELAERSNASVVGLNAALKYHLSADLSTQKVVYQRIVDEIAAMSGVVMIAPGSIRSGIVSFVHRELSAEQIYRGVAKRHINVWIAEGHHTPIYMADQRVDRAVRVSVHYYNSLDEVKIFARALHEILSGR